MTVPVDSPEGFLPCSQAAGPAVRHLRVLVFQQAACDWQSCRGTEGEERGLL